MLRKLWNGNIPLVKTFWIYGILINTVYIWAIILLIGVTKDMKYGFIFIMLSPAIQKLYLFIQIIGTWKSASK